MRKSLAVGIFTFILTVIGFIVLIGLVTQYKPEIISFSLQYPFVIPIVIILWRITAIVIPPLPGGVLSFAFIPILGWFWAFFYSEIGVMIGATISFYIARKFREPVVARFMPLQKIHDWEEKINQKTEFFGFLGIRILFAPVMDFISYAAGLSRISYRKFILATFIAEMPVAIWYYFGGEAYKSLLDSKSIISGVVLLIILLTAFYFAKNHGIFKRKEK